ncbi:helix-turn-helix domain-containing protein [Scytonema tolypothrichoides VB-61278]|nr:helix-turn-helix domain-containing protein [Scytonema tolypothrichoides VB-61278]
MHRWQNSGLAGLWNGPRSGRKPKWRPEDIESVEAVLAKEQRTYNSNQLCQKLAKNLTCSPEYPSIKKDTQKKGSQCEGKRSADLKQLAW